MTDLHDLSELARGIPSPELPSPEVKARAKEQLMNHISSTVEEPTIQKSHQRTRRSRGRTLLAGTLATAAAITALVVTGVGDGGHNGPASAGAAELQRLTEIAATSKVPGAGDILHAQVVANLAVYEGDASKTRHVVRQTGDAYVYPDHNWEFLAGANDPASTSSEVPSYVLDGFNKLSEAAGTAPSSSTGDASEDGIEVLRLLGAAGDLPASTLGAVAEIPDVQRLGTVKDLTGRSGLGFRVNYPDGSATEVIFDPETSRLLGERDVNPDGLVEWEAAFTVIEYITKEERDTALHVPAS